MTPLGTRDQAQLDRVIALVRDVLGEAVVGIYLHGSTGFGQMQPDSDLDVLVVVSERTPAGLKRRLIEGLLPISGRGDPSGRARSVELTVVVAPDLRPWHHPPPMDLMYGDWWRGAYLAGDFEPWQSPNPDLTTMLAMACEADAPVLGPPLNSVLEAIPPADLRRAAVDCLPSLIGDLETDTRNVLLTFARIWLTLATGDFAPKDVAAEWALARLPAAVRAPLARARANYLGLEPERWEDIVALVRPCADAMRAEIAALASTERASA